jgi:hypothetical protein
MPDKERTGKRINHAGSLTFSKLKNQHLRRTRRKQGKPEGSFINGSATRHPNWKDAFFLVLK